MTSTDSIPQLADQAAIDGLLATLAGRFAASSPFTTQRGAFQGYEDIAKIGPWQIGLSYSSFTKVLALTAYDRAAALQAQPLAIAVRKGRGQYDVTLTVDDLRKWAWQEEISQAAPVEAPAQAAPAEVQPETADNSPAPTPEAQPLTIWDLVNRAISAPGFDLKANQRRPLWHSNGKRVDLWRRPTDGSIVLTAKNGQPGAVTSRPLVVNPGGAGWKLVAGARANYESWQAAVSANLRPVVEVSAQRGIPSQVA